MLYKYLRSKEGFTLVELTVVATILGILTAVSVPIFGSILHKQKLNDCINQREVIAAVVSQGMAGMFDNGKKQPSLSLANLQEDHRCTYPGDGVTGNKDDAYKGKTCFILWDEKVDTVKDSKGVSHTINQVPFTLGDLRGKHRDTIGNTNQYQNYSKTAYSYNDGCAYDAEYAAKHTGEMTPRTNPQATCFLKKKVLADKLIYEYLDNKEIPVCPFVEEYTAKGEPEFFYYIFEDGTVLCSCPDCNAID